MGALEFPWLAAAAPVSSAVMRALPLFPLLLAACSLNVGDGGDDDDSTPVEASLDTITRSERPSKRSEVLAISDAKTGAVAIFGGNHGPIVSQIPRADYLDETWVFEPGVGWEQIEGAGPSARGRYAAAQDPAGRMLIFGGRWREAATTGNYTLFNDLWAYDFASKTWTELDSGDGTAPSGRYYPVSAWDAKSESLYVYGGATNANALVINNNSELWRWRAGEGWEELSTVGDAPSTRVFFGGAHDAERNKLWIFAGQVGDFQSLAYNDLYSLDLDAGVWTREHAGGSTAPFTRMHPHLLFDAARDRVLLFGGHTDIGDGNDLWKFEDGSWDFVYEADRFTGNGLGCLGNPSEVPADYVEQDLTAPERRHRAMATISLDNIWIFGGMHAECSDHLDDTWRYDLDFNSWHELIEARTGESCARRADDCECLCL